MQSARYVLGILAVLSGTAWAGESIGIGAELAWTHDSNVTRGSGYNELSDNILSANVNYTWDFDAGSLTPSASMVYKSETYYSVFNRFYNLGKEGTQFDARVIWRDAQDTYSIIGYVRNISNQTIIEGASATILAGTQQANGTRFLNRNWSVNPPRTYGVEFQYRF